MRKAFVAAVAGVLSMTGALLLAEPPRRDPAAPGQRRPAAEATGVWTGFITDAHCGKNGATKDHDAECVQKCMKGGSKPQIWNEADQKAYTLDSFDKVKALMGSKVTVKGSLDPATSTITVTSAEKAGQ